jgi:hypothetical protein
VLLLGLYAYAVWKLIHCSSEPANQIKTILSLVGGLVSALVVAVLGITPPGDTPAKLFVPSPGTRFRVVSLITWAYLVVWLNCGLVLLVNWMDAQMPTDALT